MSEPGQSARDEGARLLQAGDLAGALRSLQAAVQQNPSDARAYAFLGICHTRRGDAAAGIEALYRATQLAPADAVLRYNLGVALSQSGRVDEAKQALEQALQLNPAHAGAREQLLRLQSAPAGTAASPAVAGPPVTAPPPAAPPAWAPPIASETTQAAPPVWSPAPAGQPPLGGGYGSEAPAGGPPAWTPAPASASGPQHDAFTGSPEAMYYAQDQTYGGQPPSLGKRLLRGWGWGLFYGQWWTLWTLISAVIGIGGRPTFNAAFFIGLVIYGIAYGVFGSLAGLIIGAANLEEDQATYVGVGAGLLLLGLEFLMNQSPGTLINIFFYFFTGRYIGRGIAGRVQVPVPA